MSILRNQTRLGRFDVSRTQQGQSRPSTLERHVCVTSALALTYACLSPIVYTPPAAWPAVPCAILQSEARVSINDSYSFSMVADGY